MANEVLGNIMSIFNGYKEAMGKVWGGCVAIGNFDGMHLAHQELLGRLIKHAKIRHCPSIVYTFSPHPALFLNPSRAPALIESEKRKYQRIFDFGVDYIIVEPFDAAFASLSSKQFVEDVLLRALNAKMVVVGQNYRFGRGRKGDTSELKSALSQAGGFLDAVVPVKVLGVECSSSLIRSHIVEGKIKEAAQFLGRPFSLEGKVIKGVGRGTKIGIPTANLKTPQELKPPRGVYASVSKIDGKSLLGATNIGFRPTFEFNDELTIETHLLNFSGSLYGKNVELCFLEQIRAEKKFGSIEELKEQINIDLKHVEKLV